MQIITGLESGIVPHREFALRRWFYAHPLWYYHRRDETHHLQSDPKFYQLVDPQLRELCHLLLEAGLQTTPSCQGHFYPIERFEHIWEELQREERAIRDGGLEVRDSESDQTYVFRDEGYRLPWSDYRSFLDQAAGHQHQGYIGVVVPETHSDVAAQLSSEPYRTRCGRIEHDAELSAVFGGDLFGVFVTPSTPDERDVEWAAITRHIKLLLGQRVA